MIRVLFVCLGNICRSPMAEAIFRHKVKLAGLAKEIEVDSAGTGSWHVGDVPHRGTRRVLDDFKISHEGMTARQIEKADLDSFDYILTMDNLNLSDVRALGKGTAKIGPLMEYAREFGTLEVPDPFYTGGFEGVYKMVDAACANLLNTIRAAHTL
jgi:protein-tyrosine phosphatase